MTLQYPLYRKLRVVNNRVFIWHQRHPNLEALQKLAWEAGLVVVIDTDASGDIGWGATCKRKWRQGQWTSVQSEMSINWKELYAYSRALDEFSLYLHGKLIILKVDNTCAAHYVNFATGRINALAQLAKDIRHQEIQLACESVAIRLAGVKNVTADALSQMQLSATQRDKRPHRALKRKLFLGLQDLRGPFHIDGFAADDGHNAQLPQYWTDSNSFFENFDGNKLVWAFPPLDLIQTLMQYLHDRRRAQCSLNIAVLLPEHTSAPWFRYCQHYKRVVRYRKGSDLFREFNVGVWGKAPPTKSAWMVIMFKA